VRSGCVKNVEGRVLIEEQVLDTCKHVMTRCKMKTDRHCLSDVGRVRRPSEKISVADVTAPIAKMKIS